MTAEIGPAGEADGLVERLVHPISGKQVCAIVAAVRRENATAITQLRERVVTVERERDEARHSRDMAVSVAEIKTTRAEAAEDKVLALLGELRRIAASDGGADRLRYMANVALYGEQAKVVTTPSPTKKGT